eukprot:TRINITY_DN3742_c0_g1_i2.p2 TRINITY_DN3742_c0_g1~~TRINITY_DN3742_c0_g1_i2.p2  ORF type:complete len:140 (-),score=43.24 TRINITY_DN3742_c0_g1_i2:315-734(-)
MRRLADVKPENVYMGHISDGSTPFRDPGSKWYMSHEDFSGSVYPPFAHGPGYLISRDLIQHIVNEHHKQELKVLPLEDVSMAIWVDHAKKVHNMPIQYINDNRFDYGGCSNNMISGHYIEPDRQIRIYKRDVAGDPVIC